MAKNFKRQSVVKSTRKPSRVNGHGLAHDEGFAGRDDDAPALVKDEEENGWDDAGDESANRHGDDEAGVDATDDPVRMYLMQMGQIPLLNRAQEISSAKQ